MARTRLLHPEFFLNEELGRLTPMHALLYAGLWTQADCEGRLENRPGRLKLQILPWWKADVPALLVDLDRVGLIRLYKVEHECLIFIPKFRKHQKPHPHEKASVIPACHDIRRISPGLGRTESAFTDQKPDQKPDQPVQVFDHWRTTLHPDARVFDAKTREKVRARLAEGFTVDDLKRAIDGCKTNPHNQGVNEKGKRYDALELICRDGANVTRFIGYLAPARVDVRRGHVRAEDMNFDNVPLGEIKIPIP